MLSDVALGGVLFILMCAHPCLHCSEWSAIEKEMGDGLQSAGHHMDAYVSLT